MLAWSTALSLPSLQTKTSTEVQHLSRCWPALPRQFRSNPAQYVMTDHSPIGSSVQSRTSHISARPNLWSKSEEQCSHAAELMEEHELRPLKNNNHRARVVVGVLVLVRIGLPESYLRRQKPSSANLPNAVSTFARSEVNSFRRRWPCGLGMVQYTWNWSSRS